MNTVRILFLGDVVGKGARSIIKEKLPGYIKENGIFYTVANVENIVGGSGITLKTINEVFAAGVDIATSGDHIWKKKDVLEIIDSLPIVRPLNYGDAALGKGYIIKEKDGIIIAVVNLIGRVFMQPVDCPFKSVSEVLARIQERTNIIIVDVHAEATSEKLALGHYLSGKVSAVIGTHTHIPTADERIISGHTAYITDAGMCGSCDSILGRVKENVIERFVTNMPVRFNLADKDLRLQGVILEIDSDSGKSLSIQRVEIKQDTAAK